MYDYIKALHIIFVVTWFAGLFYIVRLYIYDVEAQDKAETEKLILTNQFRLMERRLWYGITWPSAILATVFGGYLLKQWFPLSENTWLHSKLFFVILLWAYHLSCGSIRKSLVAGTCKWSSNKLRVWNEVATLFLFAIVFIVEVKDSLDGLKATAALIGLSLLLFGAIRLYKKIRTR